VADIDRENEVEESESLLRPALPENTKQVPFEFKKLSEEESIQRAKEFYEFMNQRRTLRFFSNEPVSEDVIKACIRTAGMAI